MSCILTLYDLSKPLVVACDAIPYGIRVVLSHKLGDEECTIAYATCSLAPSEKNNSQIDKEALAVVFGASIFVWPSFTIKSDHKPLQYLLGKGRRILMIASARVQHWELTLSTYDYEVQYVPSKEHAKVDVFSCLTLPVQPEGVPMPQELICLLESIELSLVAVE